MKRSVTTNVRGIYCNERLITRWKNVGRMRRFGNDASRLVHKNTRIFDGLNFLTPYQFLCSFVFVVIPTSVLTRTPRP